MNRLLTLVVLGLLSGNSAGETIAIVGGQVHTVGPKGSIDGGTVLINDRRIVAVGKDIAIPADATTIDATGKVVTPGLFSAYSQIGLVEVSLSAGPRDFAQRGTLFTAGFDVADAYNPRSTLIATNRIEGVTRAVVVPTPGAADGDLSGHVLSGLAALVNLGDNDAVDRRRLALVVTLGEDGSRFSGGTRTAAWLILRNALDEALDYREHRADFERGMRREYVHSIADLEALQGVISGSTPMVVNVNRASDIQTLLNLVSEYSLKAIVKGGAEAWMLADDLAIAGVSVIVDPVANLPADFDKLNARVEAPTILSRAGVRVALSVTANDMTHIEGNMAQAAGNAVARGLAWDDALRAITLVPAQMYGVDALTGSLEAGKAADIVIWPGDPLEVFNFPEQVFVNGVKIPMTSRQTLLRDRYLSTSERRPAYRD